MRAHCCAEKAQPRCARSLGVQKHCSLPRRGHPNRHIPPCLWPLLAPIFPFHLLPTPLFLPRLSTLAFLCSLPLLLPSPPSCLLLRCHLSPSPSLPLLLFSPASSLLLPCPPPLISLPPGLLHTRRPQQPLLPTGAEAEGTRRELPAAPPPARRTSQSAAADRPHPRSPPDSPPAPTLPTQSLAWWPRSSQPSSL